MQQPTVGRVSEGFHHAARLGPPLVGNAYLAYRLRCVPIVRCNDGDEQHHEHHERQRLATQGTLRDVWIIGGEMIAVVGANGSDMTARSV